MLVINRNNLDCRQKEEVTETERISVIDKYSRKNISYCSVHLHLHSPVVCGLILCVVVTVIQSKYLYDEISHCIYTSKFQSLNNSDNTNNTTNYINSRIQPRVPAWQPSIDSWKRRFLMCDNILCGVCSKK